MAVIKEVNTFEDIKINIIPRVADLLVYITDRKNKAKGKDEIWFYDTKFEDSKIKFVKNFPDLKIQYVNRANKAGWVNKSHELQGRIG